MNTTKFDFKFHSPSLHTAAGQPGSGKTLLLGAVADSIHRDTGKDLYIVLKEQDRPIEEYKLPDWIHGLLPNMRVPQDCIIMGDDWQRISPARRAMSQANVDWDELEGLIRHDDIDLLLDVQTYAVLDRNAVLRVDYRWYKQPYMEESTLGRPELKQEVAEVSSSLEGQPITTGYLISRNREGYEGLVTGIPKPKWWSEELSTLHRRLTPEEIESRKPIWQRWRIL